MAALGLEEHRGERVRELAIIVGEQRVRRLAHERADVADLAFVYFDERDVVRHPLVKKIIGAYERAESRRSGDKPRG